jgi:hypothetical protein
LLLYFFFFNIASRQFQVLDKKPLKLHKLCHTNDTAVKDITKYAPHGFEYLTDQQEIAVDGATLRLAAVRILW